MVKVLLVKTAPGACPFFALTDLELLWGDVIGAWSHGPWPGR